MGTDKIRSLEASIFLSVLIRVIRGS